MRNHKMKKIFAALLSAGMLGGCAAGPDYERPELQLPEQWAATEVSDKAAAAAGERWWSLYADPVLDRLEDEALANNTDLQVALAPVHLLAVKLFLDRLVQAFGLQLAQRITRRA